MAFITLSGTLRDPTSELAVGDQIRFTHKSTTGETVEGAVSVLTIDPSGTYSKDLQYGLVLVEYKDVRTSQFKNLGVATVNGSNPATSIPELLNALVPVSSAELIEFQAILADAVTARNEAEAFAASIDLINDLSQAYGFPTVAAFKASLIEFPDGKRIYLADRGAYFTKITGTGTANTFNIIASTSVNQSIVYDHKNKISTIAFGLVPDYNATGDNGTNNVDAWKALHELINADKLHGVTVNVDGDHLIEYNDNSILESIPGGNATAKIIEGVDRIRFAGAGLLRYKKPITERVWVACFKDCQNPVWMVRELNGGFVPNSSTTITSSQHGVLFWACQNPHMNRARVHKIDGAPVSFTSYPSTPAIEVGTSTDCYLTKCNFNYFEQCSTFGGSSIGVHIVSNSFRNNWLSAFKFSSNIALAAGPVSLIGEAIFSDNTCLWDDDFQVPFDTSGSVRSEVVGVMQQGPMETLKIHNNIIDLSTIPTAQITNTLSRAVKIFGDDRAETIGNSAYMMRKLSITANTLVADEATSQCLRVTPLCRDIVITDNPYIVGVVELFTSNLFTARGDRFLFARNGMKTSVAVPPEIRIQRANFDKVIIEDIAMQGGSVKFSNELLIGELHIGKLTDCAGVFMETGGDSIEADKVYISGSAPKAIDLSFRNLEKLSVTGNTLATDATAYKFNLDTDAIVSFNGNTSYGNTVENCAVGLDLNRGKLMVKGSSFNATTYYSLGAAVEVIQGDLLGVAAPSFAATIRRGVTMVDVVTGDRYAYISGAWKLATYV